MTPPRTYPDFAANQIIQKANKNNPYWLAFLFGVVVATEYDHFLPPFDKDNGLTDDDFLMILWDSFREIQKVNRIWFAES